MPKIDILIKAFNLNPNNEKWNENQKQVALEKLKILISQKLVSAEIFFAQYKSKTKMPRDKQNKQDSSVIKIINSGKEEFYLMSVKGQYLGFGASGSVKLAIRIYPFDYDFNLYAIKREWTNELNQQEETKILQSLKVMIGDKMQRESLTTKRPQESQDTKDKFYTTMPYLGVDLFDVMQGKLLDVASKLDVSIKIALLVYHLHADIHYAHLDLKLENITVDRDAQGEYKVHLIDFGFSKRLDLPAAKIFSLIYVYGSPGYFPGSKIGDMIISLKVREFLAKDYDHSYLDVFALKRVLTQENLYKDQAMSKRRKVFGLVDLVGMGNVNKVLYEMLSTGDDINVIKRKDTVAMIAANLILHKLKLYPACILSDENSRKIISIYEKNGVVSQQELEALYPSGFSTATRIYKNHPEELSSILTGPKKHSIFKDPFMCLRDPVEANPPIKQPN